MLNSNALMTDERRWHLLTNRKFEHKITEAFRIFRESGIEPILIKGWAAARHYPESSPRSYGDIDLCVRSADFHAAGTLIRGEGLNRFGIDLHNEFRHLDSLKWDDALENSVLIDTDQVEIRVLSEEDHLRVLCSHWLIDGGAYRDRLWDIYYAVENRYAEFDWNRCLEGGGRVRRSWVIAAIAAAHRYLNLDISGLPFAGEAATIPEWMRKTLESEWATEMRLRPLYLCMNNPRLLFAQIRKRLPPNPIQATVEVGGPFDDSGRAYYQAMSFLNRIPASVQRVLTYLRARE